ncbi:MAG TPA: LysO family transporter [Candidatus Mcinerneyibacterium sp.]|nr:LysO family transporter [Candidatus Mcinerneyibacterium sp.]
MTVIYFLLAGFLIGLILRKFNKEFILNLIFERMVNGAIFLLLFSLGLLVGSNEKILNNFSEIGFVAILISLSGILGSLFIGFFINKFFYGDENEK